MITFTNLGQYGRLGNQLFQYAALKSAALKHGYVCKIPNPKIMAWHGQECLLNSFNIEAEYLSESDYKYIKHQVFAHEPISGVYTSCLENISDDTDICGFFQNIKYFENYSAQIIKELTPKKNITDKAYRLLNKFREQKPIVSLHIRRGDLTDGTNPIYLKHYGANPFDLDSVIGKIIYRMSEEFSDAKIIVFTGGSRSGDDMHDIQWAKTYFSDKKFIVSQTNDPIMDFALMSLCDHNVITGPSTFSWWASYINPNPHKIVIAPIDFHLDGQSNLREGFYPKSWKLI